MGIRETLNKNPGITTGATIAIIVLVIGVIVWEVKDQFFPSTPAAAKSAFYTDNDGKDFFVDDIQKLPPFDHDGKQAVRAHVFTCDGGKTKFIAYLEKYTPEAKKTLEQAQAQMKATGPNQQPNPQAFMMSEQARMMGILVKKPGTGDKAWVPQMSPQAQMITVTKCPDGTTNNLEYATP